MRKHPKNLYDIFGIRFGVNSHIDLCRPSDSISQVLIKMDNVITKSKDVTLLEILDRVLDKGVVISGDIVISLADVDLIYVGLKVLISSVETMERLRGAPFAGAQEEPN